MLKLQPASRRELKRISVGVLAGSAVMVAVFAAVGRFSWQVLTGAALGSAAAVGNFFWLCLSVQRAASADEMTARLIMRASYSRRMLVSAAVLALGILSPWFHWLAAMIPLLLPRATILVLQATGAFKPEKNKEEG